MKKIHFIDVDIFANKKEKTHKHINETKDTQTKEHTTKKMLQITFTNAIWTVQQCRYG